MKTTTDNHIDKLLHEAMKQRAAKVPPLADDFADKVLGSLSSLTPRPLQKKRELKRRVFPLSWRGIGGGLIAACIVLLLVFRFSSEPVEQQPVVATSEMPSKASDYSDYSENSDNSEKSEPSEPIKPKITHKVRKAKEEPQLAEAEPIVEEAEMEAGAGYHATEETDPILWATAFSQDIRARGERLQQEINQITTKL
ncbi:MAG: hypothetical protein IJ826_08215 [Bacteroidaceae bacterium]|nr:hypothetical protein [Bacteroidaceae bacterium]